MQRFVKMPMTKTKIINNDIRFIDTHCHLDFSVFNKIRSSILRNCWEKQIDTIIIPGIYASLWPSLLQFCRFPTPIRLLAALGMHPYFLTHHRRIHLKLLENMVTAAGHYVIAIGEIGLDFYHGCNNESLQIELFKAQLCIAKALKKPVIIHSRKAHDIVCKIIRQTRFDQGGIIHAFSGSLVQAETFVSLGFKLGIGGAITYERATKLRFILQTLTLDSFVLETDAPDMPLANQSQPFNTPENLPLIFQAICRLRPESEQEISTQLLANSHSVLRF